MDKNLTRLAIILAGGFFMLALVGGSIVPYKQFIGSTFPKTFPFQLDEHVETFSTSSLPDDHVVICYVENGTLYFKESYTRGFVWYDPVPLISQNLSHAQNLNIICLSGDHENQSLLAAWDARRDPLNESSRAIFIAHVDLVSKSVIAGPILVSNTTGKEYQPTIVGNWNFGFHVAYIVNDSGNYDLIVKRGMNVGSFLENVTFHFGSSPVIFSSILLGPQGLPKLVYYSDGNTSNVISHQIVNFSSMTQPAVQNLLISNLTGKISSFDASLSSSGKLVVSFQEIGAVNGTQTVNLTRTLWLESETQDAFLEEINTVNEAEFLQHVTFSNDQVLTVWLQKMISNPNYEIFYTITDFDTTNKNSIYHSMLLAYVFVAAGIYNLVVHRHLKSRLREKIEHDIYAEPLNNVFTSILFFSIAIYIMIPLSGFQGEKLGQSFADGYIYPAPINLGTLIVIGFVCLFFITTTPLIDRYWRKSFRQKRDTSLFDDELGQFTWKQEIARKIPHMVTAIFVFGFDPVGAAGMQFAELNKYNRYNFINEGAIIFDYAMRLNPLEYGSYAVKIVLGAGIIFLWLLDLHVLLAPNRYFFMKDYLNYTSRQKEKVSMADFVIMLSSILLMIIMLTFNPEFKVQGHIVSMAGITSISFGDTAGVLVGKFFGRKKIIKTGKKTWEGAIAGTTVSFAFALFFLSWPFALLVGLVYFIVDLITIRLAISDNLLIPVFTAFALLPLLPFVQGPLMGLYT